MTYPDLGPLRPRRGVSIGAFLLWIVVAGIGGAIAGDVYGDQVRSRIGIRQPTPPAPPPTPEPSASAPANDEIIGFLKDLQKDVEAAQKSTADQIDNVLKALSSEQATSKATADGLAALNAKVDELQHPPAPSQFAQPSQPPQAAQAPQAPQGPQRALAPKKPAAPARKPPAPPHPPKPRAPTSLQPPFDDRR